MNVLSDNVEKELKYNQCLFTSSIDSLPSKRTVLFQRNRHPKFGDTLETILMAPLQSVFCENTTQPKVTPTNHHWNGGSITSLSSPFLPSSSRWSSQCQHTAPEWCQPDRLVTLSFSAFLVVCDQDKKPHVGH